MNTSNRNSFLVGVATLVGFVGLAGLLVLFGELDRVLIRAYSVTVVTDDASGLRKGSAVFLNGVRIGRVEGTALQPDAEFPVRVNVLIEEGNIIPRGATFRIDQAIIGGSASLVLSGPETQTDPYPTDGNAVLTDTARTVLDEMREQMMAELEPLLAAGQAFTEFTETYTALGEEVRELLRPQGADVLEAGEPPNLATAVARINNAISEATGTIAEVNRWLGDEELREQIHTAAGSVGELIDQGTTTLARYETLADQIESQSSLVVQHLLPVLDEMSVTNERIQSIMTKIDAGEGTAGQLVHNPDLYLSLNDAAIRLEEALTRLRLFLEKANDEGVPIRW